MDSRLVQFFFNSVIPSFLISIPDKSAITCEIQSVGSLNDIQHVFISLSCRCMTLFIADVVVPFLIIYSSVVHCTTITIKYNHRPIAFKANEVIYSSNIAQQNSLHQSSHQRRKDSCCVNSQLNTTGSIFSCMLSMHIGQQSAE